MVETDAAGMPRSAKSATPSTRRAVLGNAGVVGDGGFAPHAQHAVADMTRLELAPLQITSFGTLSLDRRWCRAWPRCGHAAFPRPRPAWLPRYRATSGSRLPARRLGQQRRRLESDHAQRNAERARGTVGAADRRRAASSDRCEVSADIAAMAATGTPIVSPCLSPLMPASSLPMPASVAITALTPRANIGASIARAAIGSDRDHVARTGRVVLEIAEGIERKDAACGILVDDEQLVAADDGAVRDGRRRRCGGATDDGDRCESPPATRVRRRIRCDMVSSLVGAAIRVTSASLPLPDIGRRGQHVRFVPGATHIGRPNLLPWGPDTEGAAMKLPRRTFLHLAAGAAALPVVSRFARAQDYPSRPVRVIVPFAPGGQTDVVARLIAQKLSDRLGKQFYVENAAGAGGNIGAAGRSGGAGRPHDPFHRCDRLHGKSDVFTTRSPTIP